MNDIKDELKMIRECQIRMEGHIESNAKSLEEHMRRTDILEDLHRDNDKRITIIENGKTVRQLLKELALVASLASAIASITWALLKIL